MKFNQSNIKKAKKYLDKNYCIGVPTETVYGLAANAYSNYAVKKIYRLKKRPKSNPLIVHYPNIKSLKKDCLLNNNFLKLYKKFSPGPITYILNLQKNSKISKTVTNNQKNLAVRLPKHKMFRELLKKLNYPLAAPSANISSRLSAVQALDVKEEFGNKIKFILDGGKCKVGIESTIIDLTNKPIILREGKITSEKIYQIIRKKVHIKKKIKNIKSPGQFKFHYSPGIPVYMNKNKPKKGGAFIIFGKKPKSGKNYFNLSKSNNLNEAANNLYKTMRNIKKLKYKSISVCKIPSSGLGNAINDRLKKASYK